MGFFSGILKAVAPIAGAAVGSLILPGVGTAIGGSLGGMVSGAMGGSEADQAVDSQGFASYGGQIGTALGGALPGMASAYQGYQSQQLQQGINAQNQANFNTQLAFNADQTERQRLWQQKMQGDIQSYNADEAQKTRDWQTQMSNTQYQRAVGDMESAGLNPMLAYSQGGAGTPSGATGSAGGVSSSAASAPGAPQLMNPAVSGAQVAQVAQQMRGQEAQIDLTKASADKTRADIDTSVSTAANVRQATRNLVEENWRIIKSADLLGQQANTEVIRQDLMEAEKKYRNGQIDMQQFIKQQEAARAFIMNADKNRASAYSDYFGSTMGRMSPYQAQVESGVNSAANAVGRVSGIFRPDSPRLRGTTENSGRYDDGSSWRTRSYDYD